MVRSSLGGRWPHAFAIPLVTVELALSDRLSADGLPWEEATFSLYDAAGGALAVPMLMHYHLDLALRRDSF